MSAHRHPRRRSGRLVPPVLAAMATVLSILVIPALSPTEAGAINFPTIDWRQCRNDNGGGTPLGGGTGADDNQDPCNWVGGNLGQNNSIYTEGDVVPQRAIRAVGPAGSHFVTFEHSFYNASQNAYTYDFYATPDASLEGDLAACNDVPSTGSWLGLNSTRCQEALAARQVVPIPSEAAVNPFVGAAELDALADGVTRNLWISCGAVSGVTIDFSAANQCTGVTLTVVPVSGTDARLRVDFTTPNANSVVFVWIGGHLAKASFWNDPAKVSNTAFLGRGAASAAGSSFHQRLVAWDENSNIGAQDNSMQAGAVVPPGSITIVKDDTADTGTSFPFTAAAPLSDFDLTDDGTNAAAENTRVFTSLPTETYTIDELVPAGWNLDSVVCGSVAGSTTTTSGTGVTIELEPGDDVTCTFTNSPDFGGLQVTKVVDWSGVTPDPGQTFEICITGPTYPTGTEPGACQLADSDGATLTWNPLFPGDYVVTETDPGTEWVVSGGQGATTSVGLGGNATAPSITNTRRLGSLQVAKVVNWNGVTPDPTQTFEICITGPSYPSPTVADGGCQVAGANGGTLTWIDLIPGDYTVAETDPGAEWIVSGDQGATAVVPTDGGSAPVSTIANTRKLGSLQLTKVVEWNGVTPDPTQSFTLCITGPSFPSPTIGNGGCQLADFDGATLDWANLVPGDYTVTEPGVGVEWDVVVAPSSTAAVPADGSQATVTVTNTRRLGSLEVTKVVDWNGVTPDPAQTFEICITGPSYPSPTIGNGGCQLADSDGATLTWSDLIPGQYTVTETDPGAEWIVSGGEGDVAAVPTNGGSVTAAAVTNTRRLGSLVVDKVVDWNGVTSDPAQTFEICISGPSYPTGAETGACQTVGSTGGPSTWIQLVPGDYTVNENGPGAEWTVTGDQGVTAAVPTDGGAAPTSTITNTRKLGSLEVTKVVDWAGIPEDPTQSFEICITGPSYPSPTIGNGGCQLADSDGATLTWSDLVPGQYTVAETDPGGAWIVSGGQDASVTVPVDGGQGLGTPITNTRRTGALQVAKEVDWNGITPVAGQSFEICITGPSYPSPSVGNGGCQTVDLDDPSTTTLSWDPLIPGDYTVTETDPGAEWTVSGDQGTTVTVPLDPQASVPTVTNTRELGSLEATKVVDWNGATVEPDQEFTICISGPSYPTGAEPGACQQAAATGQQLTWADLIPGDYTVGESDPGAEWTVTGDQGVTATVPTDGGTVVAGTITNTRKLGSLEVTKVVDWNGVPVDATETFEICISGPTFPVPDANPAACQLAGPDGGTLTWTDLIPGPYEISEPDPGSGWAVSGDDGVTVTVPGDGGAAPTSTITNTHELGSLEVTKVVDWNGVTPDPTQTFEICIAGPSYPLGDEEGACRPAGFEGGTLRWDALIPGDYTVTESDPGPTWVISGGQGATATVPSNGDSVAAPAITNTHEPVEEVVEERPTTTPPPTTAPPAAPPAGPRAEPPPSVELASTGTDVVVVVAWALALVLVGVALRRRGRLQR